MKKLFALSGFFIATALFSFTGGMGGDVLEIHLNGKQVHQQFVHVNKSAKTLHLASLGDNDKVDVLYSHCGQSGKSRVLVFKNENNETIKTMRFPDAKENRSEMRFYGRDIGKAGTIKLFYRSKELPEDYLVATLTKGAREDLARKASF